MYSLPLFSPPSRSLFCLSCFSLSFSLSELAQCANVSTLPFICQSPEQRPAPSVYLCLHSTAPSAPLFSSSPSPLFSLFRKSFHPSSFSSPLLHLNPPFSPPQSPTSSSRVAFFSLTHPLCHLTSIFSAIPASPIHSPHPHAPLLFHGSWHFIEVTS